jgi:hypothetical protein
MLIGMTAGLSFKVLIGMTGGLSLKVLNLLKIEITPDLQYIIVEQIVTPPASQKLQQRLTI